MPSQHRHERLSYRPPETERTWLLAYQEKTGRPMNAILTTAVRALAAQIGPPDNGLGGHMTEYESATDLYRCTECGEYEIMIRAKDGTITPCPGLAGYGDDPGRVYLLVTADPSRMSSLAWQIRETGIGRAPRFSARDGRLLVETAPSVVDDLVRQIESITAAESIEHLTADQGRAIIADNYAAAVMEHGPAFN